MSPELMFWFMFITKMAITALFVSLVTIIAEKSVQQRVRLSRRCQSPLGPFTCYWLWIMIALSFL